MSWQFCPHCGGKLPEAEPSLTKGRPHEVVAKPGGYVQAATWKRIQQEVEEIRRAGRQVSRGDLVDEALVKAPPHFSSGQPVSTVVHIAFDIDIVPKGGAIKYAVLAESPTRPPDSEIREQKPEVLAALGYLVRDGKVVTVDDIPVGRAWGILQYWGGDRQFRRWHLEAPIEASPNRLGDPIFMDENMIAFGATWVDAERMHESLKTLLDLFVKPPGDESPVATPLVLELAWR